MSIVQHRGLCRGVATKFCLGEDGFIGSRHPNPPTPKIWFSSDFGHFILKMVENAIFLSVSRKKVLKYHFWGGGTYPADFSTAGDASPRFRRPWACAHLPSENINELRQGS